MNGNGEPNEEYFRAFHKYDGCRGHEVVASRAARRPERGPCRRSSFIGRLPISGRCCCAPAGALPTKRQASIASWTFANSSSIVSPCVARTGDRRDFCPVAAFFCFVDHNLDLQAASSTDPVGPIVASKPPIAPSSRSTKTSGSRSDRDVRDARCTGSPAVAGLGTLSVRHSPSSKPQIAEAHLIVS